MPSGRQQPSAPIDYEKTCFVIMPFGSKPVGKHKVNFDGIYADIFEPAISAVELPEGGKLRPARTDKDFHTGDIGQEMFQYLQYSRFAVADITGLNANVLYELGVRHSARESGTVILRQTNAVIPFDISHIKAFPYDYRPDKNKVEARKLIRNVLRASFAQNALDSPVQLALRAQKGKKEDLEPLLLEAENAIRRFDRPGAIATLRRALRVSNGNCLVHQRLGLMLKDNGDMREALEQFDAAVRVDPKYSEGWREKGIAESVLSREPDWTGANGEASLRKALELNPDDYDGLASLGGVLRRQKRLDEALAAYERAVAVSSGHPYPLLMAMKLTARATGRLPIDAERRRQLVRAERMRQNQAEMNPPVDSPWCFFDAAEARLYLGDPAGFLDWLRKGLDRCDQKWQGETFRSALQLLKDGAVPLDGLQAGIDALDSWIATAA
jgi:tetratricopeptide (TPR) repeat protein